MGRFGIKGMALALSLLGAAIAVGVAHAGSCIVSGSTDRGCASEVWGAALEELDARACVEYPGEACEWFDSRIYAWEYAAPLRRFKSTKPNGLMLFIR